MFDALSRTHCGWTHADLLGRLYEIWIPRNEAMAAAITATLDKSDNRPIIVILGSGHTLHNMGAYERFARRRPTSTQINVALTELVADSTLVDDYSSSRGSQWRVICTRSRNFLVYDPCLKRRSLQAFQRAAKTPAVSGSGIGRGGGIVGVRLDH